MTWTRIAHLSRSTEVHFERLLPFQGLPNTTLLESIDIPISEIALQALREGQCCNPLYQVQRWFARWLGSQFPPILPAYPCSNLRSMTSGLLLLMAVSRWTDGSSGGGNYHIEAER